MIVQILVCISIYLVVYAIYNNKYVFSEDFIIKANEILSYDTNFGELYENTKKQIQSWYQSITTNEQNAIGGAASEETMQDALYVECRLYDYKHDSWRPDDYYIEDIRRLIKEYWHQQHEEFLDILIDVGDDKRDESIYIDILHTTFPYYEDQEDEETFMVPIWAKCIWKLASIGTPRAIKCVKELRNSPYEYIRNTVEQQYKLHGWDK